MRPYTCVLFIALCIAFPYASVCAFDPGAFGPTGCGIVLGAWGTAAEWFRITIGVLCGMEVIGVMIVSEQGP